ncbi:hypothetical protein EON81_03505 [bacterium]|nr:MAG: hypothetical protein EON81_03505 [bacterium]
MISYLGHKRCASPVYLCVESTKLKVSELLGKAVIGMADGAKLGTVKDVLIDVTSLSATALLVSGEAGQGNLPLERISGIGADAVTVESSQALLMSPQTGTLRPATEIKGLPVVDVTGNAIGNVHDMTLYGDKVESIEVRSGGLFGIGANDSIIPVTALRSIGSKLVTVEVPPTPVPSTP